MAVAILYLSDPASAGLAARPVAGRSLVFRAAVAATRAGASIVGIPSGLRTARLEREVQRAPAASRAVRWLDGPTPPTGFGGPCLLLPASALTEVPGLRALIAGSPDGDVAVLAGTAADGAPVLSAPAPIVGGLWPRLAAGQPLGAELGRCAAAAPSVDGAVPGRPSIAVRTEADLARVEARLYEGLGLDADTGVDRFLHRRWSLPLTRALARTPVTPNQVSLASLAVGAGSIWSMWNATPGSAVLGVALYAVACVIDHADGELARLTAQESRLGAHLDWAIDTAIHSGLALAMAVTAARPPLALALGAFAASGVALSAALARRLPREIEVGPSIGGVLRHLGNRDLFYLLLLVFVLFRAVAPALLAPLTVLVALGSHGYWIACLAQIRRGRAAPPDRIPE